MSIETDPEEATLRVALSAAGERCTRTHARARMVMQQLKLNPRLTHLRGPLLDADWIWLKWVLPRWVQLIIAVSCHPKVLQGRAEHIYEA